MKYPIIEGAWLSKAALVYIVTQLDDRFMWRVVHCNKVTETGIGLYLSHENKFVVDVKWNCSGGNEKARIRYCKGEVIIDKSGHATKIVWDDGDHFTKKLDRCLQS